MWPETTDVKLPPYSGARIDLAAAEMFFKEQPDIKLGIWCERCSTSAMIRRLEPIEVAKSISIWADGSGNPYSIRGTVDVCNPCTVAWEMCNAH